MIEDDDWQDLQPPTSPRRLAEVTVTIDPRFHAIVAFRRSAAEALANVVAMRVQVGGAKANKLRLIADKQAGPFAVSENKSTLVVRLGNVNLWPKEARQAVAARWSGDPSTGFVIELPEDFALATRKPAAKAVAAAEVAKAPVTAPASAQPKSPAAAARRIIRTPAEGGHDFGDPPPGRSALDQRRGERA